MRFGDYSPEVTDTVLKLKKGTFVLPTDDDELTQSFLQRSFSSPGYAILFILVVAVVIGILVTAFTCWWKARKYRQSVTFLDSPRDSMPEDPEEPRDCIISKGLRLFRRSADTETTNNVSTVSGNTSSWRRFLFCCSKPLKVSYENIEHRNMSAATSTEASDHHEWENGQDHPDNLVCNVNELNGPTDVPFVDGNTEPEHALDKNNEKSQESMENYETLKDEFCDFATPKLIKEAELNNGTSPDKEDVEKKQPSGKQVFSPIHIVCTTEEITLEHIKLTRESSNPLTNPLYDDRTSDTCSYCDEGDNEAGSHSSEEQASVSSNASPLFANFANDDKCLHVRFHEE